MKKTAALLMLITIVSKLLGFGREVTLSYIYGTSKISDAYLISLSIPMVIFGFIGSGIATGYIPMYSKIQQGYGKREANLFTSNLVNILIIICSIIIIFGLFFSEWIVKFFAKGFDGENLVLAVQFTRITLFGLYFTGIIYVFSGFLQIKGNYVIPALIGFPLNLITIATIFFSSKTNIMVLAIGNVIANASQFILLIPFIHRKGYKYKFRIDIHDKHIKNMALIALPVIIGVSVNQINTLVDRTLASSIEEGGISALNYAYSLNGFVSGLFVTPIVTVLYPMIAQMAAKKNMTGLKKSVSEAINSVNLFVIPATVGAMIFAEPIVKFLYGRGAFDLQATSMTSGALFYYSIGMLGFGIRDILSRAFYSLQDTKTPMINAAIAMGMNIVLNLVLSKYMGLDGLALATSISAILCAALLFWSLRKKIGSFGVKNIVISSAKIVLASLIMGAISILSYSNLMKYSSSNLSLIGSIIIGTIIYFALILFMKIEEVDILVKSIKKKLKQNKVGDNSEK